MLAAAAISVSVLPLNPHNSRSAALLSPTAAAIATVTAIAVIAAIMATIIMTENKVEDHDNNSKASAPRTTATQEEAGEKCHRKAYSRSILKVFVEEEAIIIIHDLQTRNSTKTRPIGDPGRLTETDARFGRRRHLE